MPMFRPRKAASSLTRSHLSSNRIPKSRQRCNRLRSLALQCSQHLLSSLPARRAVRSTRVYGEALVSTGPAITVLHYTRCIRPSVVEPLGGVVSKREGTDVRSARGGTKKCTGLPLSSSFRVRECVWCGVCGREPPLSLGRRRGVHTAGVTSCPPPPLLHTTLAPPLQGFRDKNHTPSRYYSRVFHVVQGAEITKAGELATLAVYSSETRRMCYHPGSPTALPHSPPARDVSRSPSLHVSPVSRGNPHG